MHILLGFSVFSAILQRRLVLEQQTIDRQQRAIARLGTMGADTSAAYLELDRMQGVRQSIASELSDDADERLAIH